MTPDSDQTRLRELERDVAELKARVHAAEDDVRTFAPLIASQAEARATMAHIIADLTSMRIQITKLEERIAEETRQRKEEAENDRRDRERGQQERAKETRSNRTLLWVAAIGFLGTFVLAISGIIAVLVG